MAWKWLEKVLGINELRQRIDLLEEDNACLEETVIRTEKTRTLIKASAEEANLTVQAKQFLTEQGVKLTNASSQNALEVMEASQIVEKYGFKRFAPSSSEAYPSSVISIRDLQEHPEKYLHKLSKGFMNFPVGLNLEGVNKILEASFGNCYLSPNDGGLKFAPLGIFGYSQRENEKTKKILNDALALSDLNRSESECWVYLEPLDYLANHEGLEKFILERPELKEEAKQRGFQMLQLTKFIYLTALEIVGTTRIKNASELLDYKEETNGNSGEMNLLTEPDSPLELKRQIKTSLLSQTTGTNYKEIRSLLPIGSKERFRNLAGERTLEILAKDRERKGLTQKIGKLLSDYSIGEYVTLACYFARNIIENYENFDDGVKRVLSGERQEVISGKCTHYTGLTLQYLNEYLVPLHPEKFSGWSFGYDADCIGNYDHCYMKVLHVNPDQTADVYFLDPTAIAKEGIAALKTPEEVIKKTDALGLPVLIKRDAEDLIVKPMK